MLVKLSLDLRDQMRKGKLLLKCKVFEMKLRFSLLSSYFIEFVFPDNFAGYGNCKYEYAE